MIGRKEVLQCETHFCAVQDPVKAKGLQYQLMLAGGDSGQVVVLGGAELSRRVSLSLSLCGHLAFSTLGKTVHCHPTLHQENARVGQSSSLYFSLLLQTELVDIVSPVRPEM